MMAELFRLFKNILENKDIEIYSDGTSTRTFCYISDAITGYLLALLSEDKVRCTILVTMYQNINKRFG